MFVLGGVVLHGRAAVLLHVRGGILHADRSLRVPQCPCRRRQIHRAGIDAHRGVRMVARDGVLFHGDQRILIDGILRAVRERDARRAVRACLDQIALIQRCVVIRIHPGDRIHFLHLHPAVQVHEFRLRLRARQCFGLLISQRVVQFLFGDFCPVRYRRVHPCDDDHHHQDDEQCHRLVRHGVPIDFHVAYFRYLLRRRRGRRAARIGRCLCTHSCARCGCSNFAI